MTALWSASSGPLDAPLVLLIHGSMDRSTGMLKLSRALDERFLVLRYDRRGYGRSAPHAGPFTMASQVGDALDVLDGRRAVLVGHSYGGNVALALAASRPELVAGVALYESPLSWMPWWPGTTAGAAAVDGQRDPEAAAEVFMRKLVGDDRWERLPERTKATRRAEGVAMVGELGDLRRNAPWAPEQIAVPIIASYGEHGRPHHRQGMEFVATAIANARVVELPGCRHDAPLSHPELFAERVVLPLLAVQ